MANPEHVRRLREGVGAWNAWRETSQETPDLSGVDLSGLDFSDADLVGANLVGVDLSAAILDRANLSGSWADGANFHGALMQSAKAADAIFRNCDFRSAYLSGMNLVGATLFSTVFHGTDLFGTDLSETNVGYNIFARLDLRNTKGLEKLRHSAPSSVSIDTLFLSGGLPESFLRGCGVPDQFIAYSNSLVGKPIEYYSSFISYSSRDDTFTRRLYDALQGKGIRTWYAPEELKIGDRIRSRIDESIRLHDKLILVLSANSVASNWVETEVETALEREEKEKRDVLFPIAIDDEGFDSQQPWARDIRRKRHIGDFRRWKNHDDFERAFDRLVRDLSKR